MTALERPFAIKVARIINKYVNKAAGDVAENPSASVDASLLGMDDDLTKAYVPHYKRTMKTFGDRTLDGLKSIEGHMLETKQAEEDIFLTALDAWIEDNAATRVALVAETTKADIKAGIQLGLAEQATGAEMANIIREKAGGAIAKSRSFVISRTETHAASQAASIAAVDATGLELNKVFIAADDERTRETHSQTDAESHENPIAKDALFQVGADSMVAPGLGSLPEENINCRCVIGWVTPE
jgi:hypothetical protein